MRDRSVSSALNRVMFAFACVALLFALGLWYQAIFKVFQQEALRGLKQLMESRAESEGKLFLQAQDNVERLHSELLRRLDEVDPNTAEEEFLARFSRGDDGLWRMKAEWNDHTQFPSLYIQHDAPLSESLYVRALASYGLLAERGPAIVPPYYSVYMDFVEKGLMVYSPFVNWGGGATRETDNYSYPTMMGSNPANNPSRGGFWTQVYFDEEAQTWMVSVIEPLDWRGEWVGTVGHDVAIDHLMEQTLIADLEGTYDLVLSTDQNIIAHPDFTDPVNEARGDLSLETLADPHLLRINELVTDLDEYPAVVEDPAGSYFYGVAKIEGPGWFLVTVYPKSLIENRTLDAVLLPSVSVFILVLGALLLLRGMMQRLVLNPLEHLDVALEELSSGKQDLDIPIREENEFGRLARSFENLSLELKRRQVSLEAAEQDWQRTFDTVLEYIVIMDADYIMKRANLAFFSTFDRTRDQVIGQHRLTLVSETNKERFELLGKRMLESKEPVQLSAYLLEANINAEIVVSPLLDGQKEIVGYVEVGRNVTEQRVLEEQLRQSQKMDAVGQLAGGVAHDFNNLLQIIMGYAETLEVSSLRKDDMVAVEQIVTAGSKAAALTQQLLAFSRRQVMQPTNIDLYHVIESTMVLVRRLIESNVQIECDPPKGKFFVNGDQNLLEQVLINLCLNARDAMPDGGSLEIGLAIAEGFEPGEGMAANHLGYVELRVKDTGQGIELENQDRIFEPFFSTKDLNKGTGLGLATVYGIVEQHKGTIKVQSEPGLGATFSIYLPVAEQGEIVNQVLSANLEEKASGGCILIAEDDTMIRDLLSIMLTQAGYEVIVASDGSEALELFDQHQDRIQLLLLDVMMPELSGDKVVVKIRETNPEMPCLIASGYSEDRSLIDSMDERCTRFISKPFKRERLLREIKELLGS